MFFDLLAKIVEKTSPRLTEWVERSRLFIFPGRSHEILPKSLEEREIDFDNENFFLPFRSIAVEDTASVVLLEDIEKGQRGLDKPRRFLECLKLTGVDLDEFGQGPKGPEMEALMARAAPLFPPGACGITIGMFNKIIPGVKNPDDEKQGFWYDATVEVTYFASLEDEVLIPAQMRFPQMTAEDVKSTGDSAIRNAGAAIQEVMFFNSPDRFILEEIPESYVRRAKSRTAGRIVRSHERPKYTILRPREIRQRMRLSDPTGLHRRPHERRAHLRTFRSDRYTAMRGKTIVIGSMWIGPSESQVDGKRYRVILDR